MHKAAQNVEIEVIMRCRYKAEWTRECGLYCLLTAELDYSQPLQLWST